MIFYEPPDIDLSPTALWRVPPIPPLQRGEGWMGLGPLPCKWRQNFFLVCCVYSLVRGDHPNSWKNAPRMQGQKKIFRMGSRQFRESLRELLRELWVSYCSSRERPFREWNFVFREWNFQFRELLREYPGTLRELREWPFHSESVFPEIGVVPRLLI